jgi:hypothetical protein
LNIKYNLDIITEFIFWLRATLIDGR